MRRRAAVLGSPIDHSLSPKLHRAAYRELDLDWEYMRVECTSDELPAFIDSLDDTWMGLSLTMPLKETVLEIVSSSDALASVVHSANTVYRHEAQQGAPWRVANTDVTGIVRALAVAGVTGLARATVLGSGATARSAVAALSALGAREIRIHARRVEAARSVAQLAQTFGMSSMVASLEPIRIDSDILISTLPGSTAAPWALVEARSDTALFDVSYHPWPSALAEGWRSSRPKAMVVSGREMLMWQAVSQVGLMTGLFDGEDLDGPSASAVAGALAAAMPH